MTTHHNTTAAHAANIPARLSGSRMSRKQFNSYLYDLYDCQDHNDVVADVIYEGKDLSYEIYEGSPIGVIVAVHHDYGGDLVVDVMRPASDILASAGITA